ncbi:MAG: CIA30 family protein [Proteobacteria bacterium]|nr:CIA30 family protein [Pseudomonadota bacterium]
MHTRAAGSDRSAKTGRLRQPVVIDDFCSQNLVSNCGTTWRAVSDRVMGGISKPTVRPEVIGTVSCLRLSGNVQLENNGGFVQAALDLDPTGAFVDASSYSGLRLTVRGNGELYGVHLRTRDTVRSWQSYRAPFTAGIEWRSIDLPFNEFTPHRLESPMDVSRLKRVGLVAIGREFCADFSVSELALYP